MNSNDSDAKHRPASMKHVTFEPKLWADMTVPVGKLPREAGAQALWYYFMLASKIVAESRPGETLRYEGELDIYHSLENVYRSVCVMYNVDPNDVQNFWPAVDEQLAHLNSMRHTSAWAEGRPGSYIPLEKLADEYRAPLGKRGELLY